jgi:hypothetical protein
METINNLATSASNTLFGQNSNSKDVSGHEPISGEQGRGTREDPYDHGNQELPKEQPATDADARDGPSEAASGREETGDANSAQQPALKKQTEPQAEYQEGNVPDKEQQGAKKPGQEPKEGDFQSKLPHSDEEREKMMEKGEFPHDPNDHSGEPLHMHSESGDDRKRDTEGEGEKHASPEDKAKTERSKSVAQEGGDPHGSNKGTGQEYVKSSGLAADGGDFDAANPGAGAEANRLLEEKGVHKSEGNQGPPQALDDGEGANEGVKVSKLDKIKEKLHLKH